MGYFNIFYYIKHFLRRLPKKLLVALCIFLIICLCHLNGYCTYVDEYQLNEPATDVIQAYKLEYDTYVYKFVRESIIISQRNNNTVPQQLQTAFRQIYQGGDIQNYFNFMPKKYMDVYVTEGGQSITTDGREIGLFISTSSPRDTQYYTYEYARTSSTVDFGEMLQQYLTNGRFVRVNQFNHTFTSSAQYTNQAWLLMAFTNYLPTDILDTVYKLSTNTFDFTNVNQVIKDIDNKIATTNQKLADVENAINQTNDFLNDDTTSDYSAQDLPSDSMNDITASGFNDIFTRIYNAVTSNQSQSVTLTIPYINYPLTLYANYTETILYNSGFSAILILINTVWYAAISIYIIKDIYKYINQIKNGDIGHTDSNIKTEVL